MAQKQWINLPTGQVLVDGVAVTPADPVRVRQIQNDVINKWGVVFAKAAIKTGVPWCWLIGFCASESYPVGDPNSLSGMGAVGLMQLLPANFAKFMGRPVSRAEMFSPEINAFVGASFIADLRRHNGNDLVATASMYNAWIDHSDKAGLYYPKTCANHPCSDTSWGPTPGEAMYAEDSYIEKVVTATNFAYPQTARFIAQAQTEIQASSTGRTLAIGAGSLLICAGGYFAYKQYAARKKNA